MFDLYVVTDSRLSKGRTDAETARLAYEGGADAVQLRMKDADGGEMLRQALEIAEVAREMDRFFFVNDRVDVAMASGADGVHLGQSDIPVEVARGLMGDDAIIGVSVQTVEQAVRAQENGADYLGVGAVFATATKPDAVQGIGLGPVFEIRQAVDIPVVAIGGINRGNIQDVIRAGADSAAVVSAVVAQDDPKAAAHELRDLILKVRPHVPTERGRTHRCRASRAHLIIRTAIRPTMRPQDDYLRTFAVLLTEKGVVSVSDPQQIAVYDFLCGGKKRPSDIADALGFPSSSLHFVLDKMVDAGIIVRSKPDPARKEVYYSNLALRIAGSAKPTPEAVAASEETFKRPDARFTGLASVANMLESYLNEIGLDHGQLRARYATDLAAAVKDDIGQGSLEDVMQAVRDRFCRLTGYRMSVFALNPLTVVFEGDATMRSKMDMLTLLVRRMAENATGKAMAVKSEEDFSNEETVRVKVVYDRAEPEQEQYINTSLPQMAEPERFMIMEIDGTVAILMNDIQTQLVDAIYERPLCVTDVVNAVGMPRSTVTTNLLRMVEEGVASVFYSESGALYYGLSCSILMKRTRRVSRDPTPTRDAVRNACGDGRFMEGYMTYLLASLQELGFDTDYMMVVLGAKYMRTAGQDGPKNFDSYFGKMSDIAKVMGLSLSVVSVYPLTIGITRTGDDPGLAPAMTFAKGMAHQGLEMASSGIFVRVSEETPDDMKVSFKEIYPSLSMNPSAGAEAEAAAAPAPKKRTSSVRDALRNRSAKSDGRPMRTVRYITGVAMVVFAAFVVIMAAGNGLDNTASAETYELSFDDGVSVTLEDGETLVGSMVLKAGEVATIAVSSESDVGVVIAGIAYPISSVYTEEDGYYAVALTQDVTITELVLIDESFDGLSVQVYDFGAEVTSEYAYGFDGYYTAAEYSAIAGGLWVTADAWIVLDADDGEYVSLPEGGSYYLDRVVTKAVGASAEAAALPEDYATVDLGNAAFEVDGYYVAGELRVAKAQVISMVFVSTDGPVSLIVSQTGEDDKTVSLTNNNRIFSISVYQDVSISYVHVGVQ